ncbi:hypothetical protein HMI54_007730 [Coelomomyces lativittatus]|nr:hypothetical protein HMI54_007730 [Coelomomyces lativittatus]
MRRNVFQCKLHRAWHLSSLPSSPTSPCELMFGDHFYMVMTELIPEGPSKTLYLQSIPKSTLSYSPLGKQGQVSLTTQCTSACLWKLVPDDPYYLLEREGTPVQPGNRVCLQHCLSGHFLYIHPNIMYR